MKRLFLCSIFCSLFMMAQAQLVSLSSTELAKLKKLVKTNAEVKKHTDGLLETAKEALLASPNPADTILSEGILQGDPRKTKTWNSLNDMPKIYALGLSYQLTGETKYIDKASEFLTAWAKKNQPMGNPINDTNLDRLIFTYDLLKTKLNPDSKLAVETWLMEVAKQELKTLAEASKNKGSSKGFNNWNSHRIKILIQIAFALEDQELKAQATEAYLIQIEQNLKEDGSSFDFLERDALHYHVYDVDPLMVAATILNRDPKAKQDFYSYQAKNGASLKKGVHFLIPYFTGEKTHAEFVNSKAAFDKKRAANGEKGYIAGTPFHPAEARSSIALANYFEPALLKVYQDQAKSSSSYPTWQFVLNEVKRF